MRRFVFAAPLLLAACASATPPQPEHTRILTSACQDGVLDACVAVAQIDAEERQRQMQASASLMQTGAMLMEQSRSAYTRPTGFTCSTMGAFTNCF